MAKKKRQSKQAIPAEETKAERFVRVVTPRVGKAVKAIKVIGYCAGSTYEHTTPQLVKILAALNTAIDGLKGKFESRPDAQEEFDFED